MPRLPRYAVPGHPQHVIQRGNNRGVIFAEPVDITFFLYRLGQACRRFRCEIHAYVLMTNHIHLLMTPHKAGAIGKVMQSVGTSYVPYFNEAYERTGTLWEGRYRATVIDSERYMLECMRYIELNPVRAGLARHPAQFVHSSHRANAHGDRDGLVTPHEIYLALGRTAPERQAAYRALFRTHLPDAMIQEIREATHKAWVLGQGRFAEEIERLCARRGAPVRRGPKRAQKGSEADGGQTLLRAQKGLTPISL